MRSQKPLPPIGTPISMSQAAASPLLLKPVHESTVIRWVRSGIKGQKLKTWLVAGRRVTTANALEDFLKRVANQSS